MKTYTVKKVVKDFSNISTRHTAFLSYFFSLESHFFIERKFKVKIEAVVVAVYAKETRKIFEVY